MKPSPATLAASVVAVAALGLFVWQRETHEIEVGQLQAAVKNYETLVERMRRDQAATPDSATEETAVAKPSAATTKQRNLREVLAQHDPASRVHALLEFVDGVPTSGLTDALKQLREGAPEWDPEAKMAIHLLLTRWAREAPEEALAGLRTLNPGKQGGDAISILSGIASLDPKKAADWLADPDNPLPSYPFMGLFLAGSVGKEWVRQDPNAAMAWARNLPDNQRTGAYIGLLATLAGSDPATAATLGTELEPGKARQDAIANIAKTWGRQSPEAAMAWVQTLQGKERSAALGEALSSWAENQPAKAATFLATLDPKEVTVEQMKAVVEPWTNKAPSEAASWLVNRPEGDAKNEAMNTVMWRWTTADPVAASTWLQTQPPGPARDSGVGGLALATFDSDPSSSLTWAASMSDEKKRKGAIALGMKEWLKRDPEAAKSWAAKNSVAAP